MNNLTTRKIVLGLLMALVMAFSVPGIADAFEVTKSTNSVALLPITGTTSEQTFTFGIRFTTDEVNRGNDTPDDADNPNTISDDRVTVTVSGPNANITSVKVGSFTDEDTGTAIPQDVDPTTSSYTVTVKYTLASAGEKIFTVTDATNSSDRVYTAWGVQPPQNVTGLTVTSDKNVRIGYPNSNNEFYLDQEVLVSVTGTNASNAIVEFERVWGTGYIYEDLDEDSTRLDPGRSLSTRANAVVDNGTASVRLRVGSGSTIIRASIRGANLALDRNTHVVTYFYNGITPKKVSGEVQVGAPFTQLGEPLVVEFRDWYPSSISGTAIRDQEITFSSTGGGKFRPHSDNPDLNNVAGTLTYPWSRVRVKTNSSGQAKVYAVLGENVTNFTATLSNDNTTVFNFTPQVGTRTATSIDKESGDAQTGVALNRAAPNPLVVIVRDQYGLPMQGANVTFTTDSGLLLKGINTDPGSDTAATNSTRKRVVATDATGRASVRYNVGNTAGSETVRATLSDGTDHEVFNINGSGGGSDPPSPPAARNVILITLSSTSGEPGDEIDVRVTSDPSDVFATLGSNDFGATRFSPQSDVTPFTSTLLLPVEEGTHSFFATGGVLTAGRASVTVEAELGELSITAIGPVAAGVQTFSITARDSDGDLIIGAFTATLSGPGIYLPKCRNR